MTGAFVPSVDFEALGKTWRFKFGFAAICEMEAAYGGLPFIHVLIKVVPEFGMGENPDPAAVLAAKANVLMTDLAAVLLAGLKDAHPTITKATVCQIVDDIGLVAASEMIHRCATANLGGGDEDEDPRIARQSA